MALNRADYMIGEVADDVEDGDVIGSFPVNDERKSNSFVPEDEMISTKKQKIGISLRQVEFNTMSAASAGGSTKANQLHRFVRISWLA